MERVKLTWIPWLIDWSAKKEKDRGGKNNDKDNFLQPATFNTMEEERNHRKERLAASFRLFQSLDSMKG